VADDFDVITDRINDKGTVVVCMVMRPGPGGAIVLASVLDAGGMERIDGCAVCISSIRQASHRRVKI
jgi:hypothetical protein